jgi:branched-chain amino acid transport system substrate-binding protein
VFPNSSQTLQSETATLVNRFGNTWGVLYPDYAFGQSQLAAFKAALQPVGGSVKTEIAVPLNEANEQPYITKIPTDGSLNGLLDAQGGADLVRGLQVMQQFGVLKKIPVVLGSGGREFFGGVYPESVDGALTAGTEPSKAPADMPDLQAFQRAFTETAAKQDRAITQILGGADKATPGTTLGYQAYISMTALKNAMQAAHFTGKADTAKLVQAFASLKMPQGPDFPAGGLEMNPSDHQGRVNVYVLKINVQQQGEDIVETIPSEKLPQTGSCKVS